MVPGRMLMVYTRCSLQRAFWRHPHLLWKIGRLGPNPEWCHAIDCLRWSTSCGWKRLIAIFLAMRMFFGIFGWEVCRPTGRPEVYLKDAWVPICSSGISSGAGAVICKSMGFRGALTEVAKCTSKDSCGEVPPGLSELACSGQESNVLDCPHAAGSSDVFCAPSESILVSCAGAGETQGRPVKEAAPQPVLKEGI